MKSLVIGLVMLVGSLAMAQGPGDVGSVETKLVKVCGPIYEDQSGVKGIADKSTMTSYELVIDEVAAPGKLHAKFLKYQSDIFLSLKAGQSICAIGVQGESMDTRYPTVMLLNWAVISE